MLVVEEKYKQIKMLKTNNFSEMEAINSILKATMYVFKLKNKDSTFLVSGEA